MRPGVPPSWRAFGVALCALVLAVALFGVASSQDSWGTAVQYPLGTLAVLAVAVTGYVVARPWGLLLPWAIAMGWSVVAAIFEAVRSNPEWADLLYSVTLLGIYAFVIDLPLAVGFVVAVVRNRRRRDVHVHRA
jgi:hypothetical protein